MEVPIKATTPNAQPTGDKNAPRINEQITTKQVRLILSDGENIGIISTREAIIKAQEQGVDLIEISPHDEFPVCKLLDYGKYKYEMQKRKNDAKKKQKTIEIKEIKLSSNIGDNDFDVKLRAATKFLQAGNKVKFTLRFRGREMSYINLGMDVLKRAQSVLAEIGKTEQEPKLEGRQMGMLIAPK